MSKQDPPLVDPLHQERKPSDIAIDVDDAQIQEPKDDVFKKPAGKEKPQAPGKPNHR